MYLDAKGNPDGWNIEKMKSHQQEMFELLVETFPSNSQLDN